jgi:hypothetical protein
MKSFLAVAIAVIVLVSLLLISNASKNNTQQHHATRSVPQGQSGGAESTANTSASESTSGVTISECDQYAADPDDPTRPKQPDDAGGAQRVFHFHLACCDTGDARACAGGMPGEQASIDQLRERYNRARVEMQLGRYNVALPALQHLCTASYGIACLRLAQAYRKGIGNLRQDDFIAYDYARAAQNLNVAAAGDVVTDLEPLVAVWTHVQAKDLINMLLTGKLDRIPDMASTRRYFYTLFVQSEKQNSQWYVALMSNQDYLHAREVIWPVLEARLRLSTTDTKRIYGKVTSDLSATTDWRALLATAGSSYFEIQTWLQNSNSVQVALGAQDAQKLFEWFNACGGCITARNRYQQNLAALMRLWSSRPPRAEREDVLCPLLTDHAQTHCLPLDDYHGTDEGGRSLGILKHAGGQ